MQHLGGYSVKYALNEPFKLRNPPLSYDECGSCAKMVDFSNPSWLSKLVFPSFVCSPPCKSVFEDKEMRLIIPVCVPCVQYLPVRCVRVCVIYQLCLLCWSLKLLSHSACIISPQRTSNTCLQLTIQHSLSHTHSCIKSHSLKHTFKNTRY